MSEPRYVKLSDLKGGVLEELFQCELARVVENARDLNTDWKAKRKITMTLEFKLRSEDRDELDIVIAASSKLSAYRPAVASAFIGPHKGEDVMIEPHPVAGDLFTQPQGAPAAVAEVANGS